jgi:CheY-like chemotaxis protein
MNAAAENSILIVEDEADAREALTEFLEAKGYRVECAQNGLEALEEIRTKKPSLILLDLMMPLMDGYAFLDQASKSHLIEDIPVVVTSAYQSRYAPGAAAVVRKPIRPETLIPVIERLVRRSGGESKAETAKKTD